MKKSVQQQSSHFQTTKHWHWQTYLCDKVGMETRFVAVLPPFGAGHLLPDNTTVRGPGGAVQILQQLTATQAAVLVPGDADF